MGNVPDPDAHGDRDATHLAVSMGLGVCFGAVVGALIENVGLGVALGLVFGGGYGAYRMARQE